MNTRSTIKSWGSLALGLFFTAITACTIFKDVFFDGAAFSIVHLQAAGALVAAISAGHYILPTLMQGRIPAAVGLFLIFAASTGYIVVSAGSRNAEVSGVKAMEIEKRNQAREAARDVLARAEKETETKRLAEDSAVKAAIAECSTGKKTKCEGKMAIREAAKIDHEKAKSDESLSSGRLLLLGPDEQAFAGYHHTAKTLAAIGIGEADLTEAKLELLMPFALVLISEMATLVFIGMALGYVRPVKVPDTSVRPAETSDTSSQTDYPSVSESEIANVRALLLAANDDPSGPDGGSKIIRPRRWLRDEVRADLEARLAAGEQFPSQRAMSAMYGVPTSTLSDWFIAWSEEGAEIERTRVGRRKMVG